MFLRKEVRGTVATGIALIVIAGVDDGCSHPGGRFQRVARYFQPRFFRQQMEPGRASSPFPGRGGSTSTRTRRIWVRVPYQYPLWLAVGYACGYSYVTVIVVQYLYEYEYLITGDLIPYGTVLDYRQGERYRYHRTSGRYRYCSLERLNRTRHVTTWYLYKVKAQQANTESCQAG